MVSSSRPAAVSGDWRTNPVGTEQICWEFNRHMIALGERVGDALYDGKFDATTNHGMQHFYEFMNLYNFNLYGDPALAVNRAVATEVAEAWSPAGGRTLRVEAARPNPFLTTSGVPFALSAPASVRIAVYDVLGREIAVLADRRYDAGRHAAQWDGTDATGGVPAPGLYFLVVEANGERAARKVVRLR
jgi:hypothetical protein